MDTNEQYFKVTLKIFVDTIKLKHFLKNSKHVHQFSIELEEFSVNDPKEKELLDD